MGLDRFIEYRPDVLGSIYEGDECYLGWVYHYTDDAGKTPYVLVVNPDGPFVGAQRFVVDDARLVFDGTTREGESWVSQEILVQWLKSDGIPSPRVADEADDGIRLEDIRDPVMLTFDVRIESDACPDGDRYSLKVDVSDAGDVDVTPMRNGASGGCTPPPRMHAGPAVALGAPTDDQQRDLKRPRVG